MFAMKKYFLLLFLLITFKVNAMNTVIEGHAKAFNGRVLRLSAYADMVTNRTDLLGTALIGKDGSFSMQVEIPDTLSCILGIGFRKTVIYLVPGGHYYCNINANADSIQQQRLPSVVQELPLLLENLAGNDINFQISRFNKAVELFLEKNANILKPGNKKAALDSLRAFRQQFNFKPGSFTYIFTFYRLADLESMINRWNDKVIFDHFLKDRPVLYGNPAYMDYFNIFYENFLTAKSTYITFRDLDLSINKNVDLELLKDLIGKDSLLRNERIRELVLLENLGELFHNQSFQSQNVLTLIQKIGESTKYPEHKVIANNLVYGLIHLTTGSAAPEFSFIDQARVERTLSDFRGKWVYLSFFISWCEPCVTEMKMIPALKQQFGNKVEFISLCCNENPLDLEYFLKANKDFDWVFFNLNDSMEIIENYQVMTYPFYVLIDPDGKIFQYPAKSPEDHLKDVLELVLK